jgi:hypothetical protein
MGLPKDPTPASTTNSHKPGDEGRNLSDTSERHAADMFLQTLQSVKRAVYEQRTTRLSRDLHCPVNYQARLFSWTLGGENDREAYPASVGGAAETNPPGKRKTTRTALLGGQYVPHLHQGVKDGWIKKTGHMPQRATTPIKARDGCGFHAGSRNPTGEGQKWTLSRTTTSQRPCSTLKFRQPPSETTPSLSVGSKCVPPPWVCLERAEEDVQTEERKHGGDRGRARRDGAVFL